MVDGFTYVRNGFAMGYPFLASIRSVLPFVNQMIVVVGNSTDGTREAVLNLNSEKITIVDSVWDEEKRKSGEIFREQSDIGIGYLKGDWAFHIQADEVLMEDVGAKIIKFIELADKMERVDGLLFPFLHFWGDYNHIRHTRKTNAFEIRAFKNHRNVRSYRDSQGFRIFDPLSGNSKGKKLRVLKTDIPIFHYSYTRPPKLMSKKCNYFERFYHSDEWLESHARKEDFDFNKVDRLTEYNGPHPVYMKETIQNKDWEFHYDPSKSNMRLKDRLMYPVEKYFGYRMFEYRNYIIENLPVQ